MKNQKSHIDRRQFISNTASLMAGMTFVPSVFGAPAILKSYHRNSSIIDGVRLGVITYSFRTMPDQSAEATLEYVVESGMSEIELMGDPAESFAGKPDNPVDRRAFYGLMRAQRSDEGLSAEQEKEMADMRAQMESYNKQVAEWRAKVSMDKFVQLKKMYADRGITIYAFKPNAFGSGNSDAEVDYGMRAAKALGATHITLEHPSDDNQTKRLGIMGKKHKVYVGYHGHEQQTPTFWDTALEQSPYNAMNLDVGHYIAAGNTDPLGLIRSKHNRIASMHVKDRKNPDHGKDNVRWGSGDTPIPSVLQLMRDEKYTFPATVELEYPVPDGSDAVQEVRKCLEFCKEALT